MRQARRNTGWILGLIVLGIVGGWRGAAHAATAGPPAEAAGAVNAFGFDLIRQLGRPEENVLISPYSIETALAMTRAGALGRTAEQMGRVLHLAGSGGAINAAFANLQTAVQEQPKPAQRATGALRVANGLWAQDGFPFQPAFRQTAEQVYGAQANAVDFQGNPEGARQAINGWVSKVTEGKIVDLVPGGGVSSLTRLVLVNALYFKSAWAFEFSPHATHVDTFYVGGRQESGVSTMHLREKLFIAETDALQCLQLPYASGQASMWIVLPRKRDGLAALERWITPERLDELGGKASFQDVAVALPRFTFRSEFSLSTALKALGMRDAFGPEADFSGMTTGKDLKLSEVYHQTYVAVTEQGTEAAAATAARMDLPTARIGREGPRPVFFTADHPFLVFIRHDASGVVLFQGRVTNPNP